MLSKLMDRLFSRLQVFYGNQFNRMWHGIDQQEIKATWADALGGFTASNIKAGLDRCLSEQYPPNLPQFISYCRVPAERLPISQIEDKGVDKETAARLLSEIKQRYFLGAKK